MAAALLAITAAAPWFVSRSGGGARAPSQPSRHPPPALPRRLPPHPRRLLSSSISALTLPLASSEDATNRWYPMIIAISDSLIFHERYAAVGYNLCRS